MIDKLIACGINPTQAKQFAEPLKAAMALHDISTPARQAAFIAQCCVESQFFTKLEENLWYTTPARIRAVWPSRFSDDIQAGLYTRNPQALANRVYANRNGNGDEASGDGWNFRGRGLFQLTGRDNYRAASVGIGLSSAYIHRPDMVAEPSDAALTAAWFWTSRGCNQWIDADQFDKTTRAINGPAMLHRRERADLYRKCRDVFASV